MKRFLKIQFIAAVISLLLFQAVAHATIHVVQVSNFSFTPQNISSFIIGDTIKWQGVSGFHTTTSSTIPAGAAAWDQVITSGGVYLYIPSVTGTYNYVCTPHEAFGMIGSFNVVNPLPVGNALSGTFKYFNLSSTGIPNSTIQLKDGSGSIVATTTTSAAGAYSFALIPNGTYTLKAIPGVPWGGANSFDALAALRHFVNSVILTGVPLLVGDVNSNLTVNSLDGLLISKRFAGVVTSFAAGDWYIESPQVVLAGNTSFTSNFKACCFGDINGSYNPSIAKVEPSLSLANQKTVFARPGQSLLIPLLINQEAEVGAISLILQYPEEDLTIESVEPAVSGGFTEFTAKNGELRISWFSLDPMKLEAGSHMIRIQARLKEGVPTGRNIDFIPDANSGIADKNAIALADVSISIPHIKSTLAAVKHTIAVSNFEFTPADLTGVIVGDTIEWVRTSGTHTATSSVIPANAPAWDALISSGSPKFDYKVLQPGVYNYVCTPHESMGMIGKFTATAGSGVGITNLLQQDMTLEITPNPVVQDCRVVYTATSVEKGSMQLIDMLGNVVMEKNIEMVPGKNTEQLSLQSVSPGLYQLRLIAGNGQAIAKKLIRP